MDKRYIHPLSRILLAFLSGYYILIHGKWSMFLLAFTYPSFYLALIPNMLLSLLIIEYILYSTRQLDRYAAWEDHFQKRLLYQLLFGILIPVITELTFVYVYFSFKGENFIQNDFLMIDFPVVFFMITLLNVYLMARHHKLSYEKKKTKDPSLLMINYNGIKTALDMEKEVAFVYKSTRYLKVITIGGKNYNYPDSIANFVPKTEGTSLVRINRSALLNILLVESIEKHKRRASYQIHLKHEYKKLLGQLDEELLKLTQDNLDQFEKELERIQWSDH